MGSTVQDTSEKKRTVALSTAAFVAVGLLVVMVGFAGTVTAQEAVGECTTIDSPGEYELTENISSTDTCIEITTRDVTLDGQGFNVTGDDIGIFANGPAGEGGEIEDVTVRNVVVEGSNDAIDYRNVTGGSIENVIVRDDNFDGVLIMDSSNLVVADSDLENGIQLEGTVNTTIRHNDLDIPGSVRLDSGSDNVTVDGNEIESEFNRAIVVDDSDDALLRDNTVTDISADAIEINAADNATVTGNSITGQDYNTGISVTDASGPEGMNNTVITDNSVSNAKQDGVRVSMSPETVVAGNNVSENLLTESTSDAVEISNSEDSYVIDNEVSRNDDDGVVVSESNRTVVSNNTITDSDGNGLEIEDTFDGVITENEITDIESAGIRMAAAGDNLVADNVVTDTVNSNGIFVTDVSTNNELRNNTFRRNGLDGEFGAGIKLFDGSDDNLVVNNTVDESYDGGIEVSRFFGDPPANNTIRDNHITNSATGDGVFLDEGTAEHEIDNNTVVSNDGDGFSLSQSDDNVLRDNLAENNTDGFSLDGSENNTLTDNLARDNDETALLAGGGSNATVEGLDIGASTAENTTLSFNVTDAELGPVDDPPEAPENNVSIGRYFEATNTSGDGELTDLELAYEDDDVPEEVAEGTLSLLKNDTTEWERVEGSDVDTGEQVVTADVTEFSTFGAFAQEEAEFEVDIVDTNSQINETEVLEVTANVTNTGGETGTQTVTLNDTYNDDIRRDSVDVTLDGGESNGSVVLEWDTERGDNGTGDVTVASDGDTDTEEVTVRALPFFTVDITDTNEPVEGDDLTVNGTVENTGDVQDTQEVSLTEFDGNEVDDETFTLDGGDSDTFNLTWNTDEGDAGTDDVTVASQNGSDSRTVTVTEESEGPFFGVTVDAPEDTVIEGDDVVVEYTVENTGDQQGTQEITFSVNGTPESTETVTLPPGADFSDSFSYMTEEGDAPEIETEVSSDDDTASSTVTVEQQAEETFFEVDVTEHDEEVLEGEDLSANGTVTNSGGESDTQTISLMDFSGETVDETSLSLGPGDEAVFNLTWETGTDDVGEGELEVSSADDTSVLQATVVEEGGAEFDVSVIGTNSPVAEGEELEVSFDVTNTGDASGTETVTLSVGGVEMDSETVTLDPGSSETRTLSWESTFGESGERAVTISGETSSDTVGVRIVRIGPSSASP